MEIAANLAQAALRAIVVAALLTGCTSNDSGVVTQSIESTSARTSTSALASTASSSPPPTNPSSSLADSSGSETSLTPDATSSVAPWPSDFTPAQQDAARASVNAVLGFQDVLVRAQADPAGKGWTAEFRKYATQEVTDPTVAALASMVAAGVHVAAPLRFESPVVISADSNRVVVEVCLDAGDAQVEDAAGNPVDAGTGASRSISVYNLALYAPEDGGWLIFETPEPNPVRTC